MRLVVALGTILAGWTAQAAAPTPCETLRDNPLGPAGICIESARVDTSRVTPDGNGYLDQAEVSTQVLVRGGRPADARGGELSLFLSLTVTAPNGTIFDADMVEEPVDRFHAQGPSGILRFRERLVFDPVQSGIEDAFGSYSLAVHAELRRTSAGRNPAVRVVASDAAAAGPTSIVAFSEESSLLAERAEIENTIGLRDLEEVVQGGGPVLRVWEADPTLRARGAEISLALRAATLDDAFDEEVSRVVEDLGAHAPSSSQIQAWRELFDSSGGLLGVHWQSSGLPIALWEPNLGPRAGDPGPVAEEAIADLQPALGQMFRADPSDALRLRVVRSEPQYGYAIVELERVRGGFVVPANSVMVALVRVAQGTQGDVWSPVALTAVWQDLGAVGQPLITYEDAVAIAEDLAGGRAKPPGTLPLEPNERAYVHHEARTGRTLLVYAVEVGFIRYVVDATTGDLVERFDAAAENDPQLDVRTHPYDLVDDHGFATAQARPMSLGYLWDASEQDDLEARPFDDPAVGPPSDVLDAEGVAADVADRLVRLSGRYAYQARNDSIEEGAVDDALARELAPFYVDQAVGVDPREEVHAFPGADFPPPPGVLDLDYVSDARGRILAELYLPITQSLKDADDTGWSYPLPRPEEDCPLGAGNCTGVPDWLEPGDPWPIGFALFDETLNTSIACSEDADCQVCQDGTCAGSVETGYDCFSEGEAGECTPEGVDVCLLDRPPTCVHVFGKSTSCVIRAEDAVGFCFNDNSFPCTGPEQCPLVTCDLRYAMAGGDGRCRTPDLVGSSFRQHTQIGNLVVVWREAIFDRFYDYQGAGDAREALVMAGHEAKHRDWHLNNAYRGDCSPDQLCLAMFESQSDWWGGLQDRLRSASAQNWGGSRNSLGTAIFNGDPSLPCARDEDDPDFPCPEQVDDPSDQFSCAFVCPIDSTSDFAGECVVDEDCSAIANFHSNGAWFNQALTDLALSAGPATASRVVAAAMNRFGYEQDMFVAKGTPGSLDYRYALGTLYSGAEWDVWRAFDRHVGDAVGPVTRYDDVPGLPGEATPLESALGGTRAEHGEEAEVDVASTIFDADAFTFRAVPGETYVVSTNNDVGSDGTQTRSMLLVEKDGEPPICVFRDLAECVGEDLGRRGESLRFEVAFPQQVRVTAVPVGGLDPFIDPLGARPHRPARLSVRVEDDDVPDGEAAVLALGIESPTARIDDAGDVDVWRFDVPDDVGQVRALVGSEGDVRGIVDPLGAAVPLEPGVERVLSVKPGSESIAVECTAGVDCSGDGYTLRVRRVGGSAACEATSVGARRVDETVCRIAPRAYQVRQLVPSPGACPDIGGRPFGGGAECPPSRWSLEACLEEGQHVVFEALSEEPVTLTLYGERSEAAMLAMVPFTSATGGGLMREHVTDPEPTLLPFVAHTASVPEALDATAEWCYRLDVEVGGGAESVELRTHGMDSELDETLFGVH